MDSVSDIRVVHQHKIGNQNQVAEINVACLTETLFVKCVLLAEFLARINFGKTLALRGESVILRKGDFVCHESSLFFCN